MARILLFSIPQDKLLGIRLAARVAGAEAVVVSPQQHGAPLGSLASGTAPGFCPGTVSGEMLVMCGLTNAQTDTFLARLRANGCPVALKAVLTPTNAAWSAARLSKELQAEHNAIQRSVQKHK